MTNFGGVFNSKNDALTEIFNAKMSYSGVKALINFPVFMLWQFQKESIFDPKGSGKNKSKIEFVFFTQKLLPIPEPAHLKMLLGFFHKIPRVIHIINTTGSVG